MSTVMSRAVLRRPAQQAHRLSQIATPQRARYTSSARQPLESRIGGFVGTFVFGLALSSGIYYLLPRLLPKYFGPEEPAKPAKPVHAKIVFEERPKTESKEKSRELLSSPHVQVKKSWESPGVYAWGSNAGKVVAPDSDETFIKTPRRISYFDGQLLRDLKLDRDFGAAVTENGDLVQWGSAFSRELSEPVVTLKGKDLVKVAITQDRIVALASDGLVYSVPVSRQDQETGQKEKTGDKEAPINYRTLKPKDLGYFEKMKDVSCGAEHCLFLTSSGRVFSAAASTVTFPSKGQLGIPGLSWKTRPQGPFDQLHEVASLHGVNIKQIATGAFHSLALDKQGKVHAFGDNAAGQLGLGISPDTPHADEPFHLNFEKVYEAAGMLPKVTSIAAGGLNSFFTVDATGTDASNKRKIVSDVWACGNGVFGSLGHGKWQHVSTGLVKVPALSSLSEYDEASGKVVPIRVGQIIAGATHASAIMDNLTRLSAKASSAHDINWGSDIVWWGGNEHYQLGTGKRMNKNSPTYIAPLDAGEADQGKRTSGEDNQKQRLQITPRKTVRLGEDGKGRKVSVEQRVTVGRYVSAVYSGA